MAASSLIFGEGSRRRQCALAKRAPVEPVSALTRHGRESARVQPTAASAGSTPATTNAPSVTLPLAFILTGLGALLAGLLGLVWRPELLATYHYNQYVIALTHLMVLGWLCTAVMGAVYQLVPVALETKLHSERLAMMHFAFHVVGFAGMVWMFWRWDLKQVGHYGSVFAFGVGLFAYNVGRTLLRVHRWNVIATAVASAVFWLGCAVLAGLCVAAAKCSYESAALLSPASFVGGMVNGLQAIASYVKRFDQISVMHAHAHLGVVGFFLILIVGVSFRLVPMFTLSEIQSPRRAVWSVILLNFGLAGSFVTVLLRSPWKLAVAGVILAGLILYGFEIRAILRARKRRVLDWGLRQFLTATSLLVPVALLGVVLAWPGLALTPFTGQLENLYGALALLGVVTFAILGMLYKIIPFLVWYSRYRHEVGRHRVPSFGELYSGRLQVTSYWLYVAGLVGLSVATLAANAAGVRAGAGLLAVSVILFTVNVTKILSHFFKPLAASSETAPAGQTMP